MTNPTVPAGPEGTKHSLGALSEAVASLVTTDARQHPTIDIAVKKKAVDLAYQVGLEDGTTPGCDEHSSTIVMPAQDFMANSVESSMARLGGEVDQAIGRSRLGTRLAVVAPPSVDRKGAVLRWLGRHALLAAAIVVVAILEYVIGTGWTQRVFDISDDTAHVVALALPVVFGLIGFAIAEGIMLTAESRVRRAIGVTAVLLGLLAISTIVCAGLIISGVVANSTGGGDASGITGGVTTASSDTGASDLSFQLVKFTVYISLLLSVTVLVMFMHLMDLWRAKLASTRSASRAAQAAPTHDQIAAGNIKYLESYIDIYKTLIQDREDFINSYVAGVRRNLAPAIADSWDSSGLGKAAAEPQWVPELEREIERLQSSTAGSAQAQHQA